MDRRTIECYLGGIWRRLEQLEQFSGRFPSVDQSSRFAGVPSLGKPLNREKTATSFPGFSPTRPTERDILQEVTLSLSKDFVHYFRRSRSGQIHSLMAALTCLRCVETNLTLTCPSSKSFVCNLQDSGKHVTSVFQGLSLSRSVGRVGENPGNEVEKTVYIKTHKTAMNRPVDHTGET